MGALFEELDWRETPMGELSLRRRREPTLGVDVYEVQLDDEFLMSSLFTHAEIELARLGLAAVDGDPLDVMVGGLGLGYTAQAVLDDPRVRALRVVEAQPAVIEWHQRSLLPTATALVNDSRCVLDERDFFAAIAGAGFGSDGPDRWHAILVDIDHTPDHLLHPSHASFYTRSGLEQVRDLLHPGGIFGLWSDAPPEEKFLDRLRNGFTHAEAQIVPFGNHYTGGTSANTVYLAKNGLC